MIRKLFQRLFGWPCDHDWTLEGESFRYYEKGVEKNGQRLPNRIYRTYRCSKCCDTKQVEA